LILSLKNCSKLAYVFTLFWACCLAEAALDSAGNKSERSKVTPYGNARPSYFAFKAASFGSSSPADAGSSDPIYSCYDAYFVCHFSRSSKIAEIAGSKRKALFSLAFKFRLTL
jgi:hypothetical protein